MKTPESQEPLGTPLSSPGMPFVPLVVEWNEVDQLHITESLTEIVALAGEKTLPPDPTAMVVVAAQVVCAKAAQNETAATITVTKVFFLLGFIDLVFLDYIRGRFQHFVPGQHEIFLWRIMRVKILPDGFGLWFL
jgi:hypothetical protein